MSDWELSKENVQPLKSGRRMTSLSLQYDQSTLRKEKQEYETALRMYNGDDPLEMWHSYILWIEQAFPKGGKSGHLVELCERCISQFKDDDRYKNDQRYIDVWIKYSNCTNDPYEVYQFMYDQKIGGVLSSFYEAWATCAEIAGNHKKANAIYQFGIENGAQPIELLTRRHEEFQKRVMRGVSLQNDDDQLEMESQDSRMALGQLKTVGKKRAVSNIRVGASASQGGLGMRPLAPVQTVSRMQIFNDENAVPTVLPDQTGEWAEIPHRKIINKENEQKAGPWTKGKRFPTKTPSAAPVAIKPSFTVHVEEEDQHMTTPMKMPDAGKLVLSSRKPGKPVDPLHHIRSHDVGDPTQIPAYCKTKIYCGADEFSFEEIRAARWRNKCKREEERRKLEQERREIEASRDELRRNQEFLRQQAEEIRQQSEALKKEQEEMVAHCRQQLLMQREHFNKERELEIQRQKEQLENDIQRRMQDNISGTLLNRSREQKESNTPSNSLLHNQTPREITPNNGHLLGTCNQEMIGQREHIQDSLGASISHRTPSTSGPISAPTPESFRKSLTAPSPTVTTKEAMNVALGIFNAPLEIDKFNLQNNEHMEIGAVPSNPVYDTGYVTEKPTKSGFVVFDENNVQDTENKGECKTPFVVFDENSAQYTNETNPVFSVYEERKSNNMGEHVRKLPFAVFDENSERQSSKMKPSDNQFQIFDENAMKSGEIYMKRNRKQVALPDAPKKQAFGSVIGGMNSQGQEEVRIPFNLIHDEDERMEGIESQACNDFTIAPVGSHLSFAEAARCASTPFNTEKNSMHSIPDISQIHAEKTRESFFVTNNSDVKDLSPIMEGSTEESDGQVTNSTTNGKHLTQSTFQSNKIANNAPAPSSIKSPVSVFSDDNDKQTEMEDLNKSEHVIDMTTYIPPDLDEKTEALLSTSIYVDPHNPFDADTLQSFLDNLAKPLSSYDNYVRERGNIVLIQPSEITILGGEMYSVTDTVGKGGNAKVFKAGKMDSDEDIDLDFTIGLPTPKNVLALKVQSPSCPWEFYICNEIQDRLSRNLSHNEVDVRPAMMSVEKGCFFDNASCLITKYYPSGTLLDFVNKLKIKNIAMEECIALYLTTEMLYMVEKLHKCHIIHGDIKPDNFMLIDFPTRKSNDQNWSLRKCQRPLVLIDFGQSIDMTKYPPSTTFMAKVKTDGFQCIEMKTDRPWTYQTDLFGLVGTIHVLLFKQYMKVYQQNGIWKITQSFPRKWNQPLWKRLFHTCLNIASCDEIPDLSLIRKEFEENFLNQVEKYTICAHQMNGLRRDF